MNLEYLPLLRVQRELYDLPRGYERFREYLRTMVDPESGDLKLPLVAMNPMGKDHLPPFLDHLLAIGADEEGSRAVGKASGALRAEPGDYRVCTVVSDDLKGGWTNRYASEYSYRFEQRAYASPWLDRRATLDKRNLRCRRGAHRGASVRPPRRVHTTARRGRDPR